jgi:hypothetical protein
MERLVAQFAGSQSEFFNRIGHKPALGATQLRFRRTKTSHSG